MAINIKMADFEQLIIKQSVETPVLIDFWASWCNPCKALGKVLDELENTYQGKVIFTKVNTEEEQSLAAKFQISSIPYVALFYKGRLKDHFTGALPKTEIIKFIEKNLPNEDLTEAHRLFNNKQIKESAELIIEKKLKTHETDELIWKIVLYYFINTPDLEIIKSLSHQFTEYGSPYFDHKEKLAHFFKFQTDSEDVKQFLELLKPDKTKGVLDNLLEKISNSKGDEKDNYKNLLFLAFHLLQGSPLVAEYRKNLSRILF